MATLRTSNPQYDDLYGDQTQVLDTGGYDYGTGGGYTQDQSGQWTTQADPRYYVDAPAQAPPTGAGSGYWAGNQWVNSDQATADASRANQQRASDAYDPALAGDYSAINAEQQAAAGGKTAAATNPYGIPQELYDQFMEIGRKNGRTWRPDEILQWMGPSGYLMSDNINGQGQKLGKWSGGAIDPYWAWRIGTHARGDYNGDNPAELGVPDANMRQGQPTGGGQSSAPPPTMPPAGGGGGGAGGPAGFVPSPTANQPSSPGRDDILARLNAIMNNGGQFDTAQANRATESARELMEKRRRGEMDQMSASLADRGLEQSGEMSSAMGRLGSDLNTDFSGAVRDIYSKEAQNASDRYAQALSLATGISVEDAKNAVATLKIQSDSQLGNSELELRRMLGVGQQDLDRMLGLGSLDIQRLNAMNNYDLGLGGLENNRDSNSTNLLQLLAQIWGNSQNGYQS